MDIPRCEAERRRGGEPQRSKRPRSWRTGGAGTRDGHWRESVLANELMTGWINAGSNPLSVLSVRSLAVAPDAQGLGVGVGLLAGLERLALVRGYATLFAVSNSGEFFRRLGYEERHIPELDRERSAVSKYKGVHAKDLG